MDKEKFVFKTPADVLEFKITDPWELDDVDNIYFIRDKGGLICTFVRPTRYTNQEERYKKDCLEMERNARLMQAAPHLLKALIEISAGRGRYNEDRLIHASNTIEDMKQEAINAIRLLMP